MNLNLKILLEEVSKLSISAMVSLLRLRLPLAWRVASVGAP